MHIGLVLVKSIIFQMLRKRRFLISLTEDIFSRLLGIVYTYLKVDLFLLFRYICCVKIILQFL